MEHDGDGFVLDDHRVAFVFGQDDETAEQASRPTKRRKVSKKAAAVEAKQSRPKFVSEFLPLFNGAEKPELAVTRQRQFLASWTAIDGRIQDVLKDSNRTTLNAVASFIRDAPSEEPSKIHAALIVTGPNIASQDLLFSQLAESLSEAAGARFVRLRSAEAPNLKATLKKIIRDVTRPAAADEGEDAEVAVGKDGRKYLDYDLEALHEHIRWHESHQVVVAFQDSEAFDTGLLSDLITLFKYGISPLVDHATAVLTPPSSWKDRIPFTLLFGIATSVELFAARLPKSTSHCLYGAQFDVVQMSSILESVFKCAVAHMDSSLKLGPAFLSSLVERQQNQVVGVQAFISSLKYAYMCHFYANPLSTLLVQGTVPQPEHIEALRNLPSFRTHVEGAIEAGQLTHARNLVEDNEYLSQQLKTALQETGQWEVGFLRSLALLAATEVPQEDFITIYINALAAGIDLKSDDSKILESVKRMSADDISSLLQRLKKVITNGDHEFGLNGWAGNDDRSSRTLCEMAETLASLQAESKLGGKSLRSQYSAQGRILRTTVVAQKVQLSHDESSLTRGDKAFTNLIDRLVDFLATAISCKAADSIFMHELWMYESRSPHKDVFIPRPGTIFARALSRPHDYLACACCDTVVDGGNSATLPATSILYHLYEEAGALMNVADLWTAFYALVGKADDDDDDEPSPRKFQSTDNDGYDERTALVLFYQGLADLKATGFVKATRRRADHVAKNKWLW